MTKNEFNRKCPICGSADHEFLFGTNIENFDQYSCLNNIRVVSCNQCGFVFNDSNLTPELLNKFYSEETPYSADTSEGAGGSIDEARYSRYVSILKMHIKPQSRICDVGCAKGGLVRYLFTLGYSNVCGVETSQKLLEKARVNTGGVIIKGTAENIPLPPDGKKYDCIIFSHVFEHLLNFDLVLKSIDNVLSDNGFLFIETPNVESYDNDTALRYAYYFLMEPREHINHFSEYHLRLLLKNCFTKTCNLIENPNVGILFKSGYDALDFSVKYTKARQHVINSLTVSESRLKEFSSIVDNYVKMQTPIVIWGIGAEFFIAASLTNIIRCNITKLVDRNERKRRLTFRGQNLFSPDVLRQLDDKDTIFIFSALGKNKMVEYLYEIGCKNKIIIWK